MNLIGYFRESQGEAMNWCLNNGIKIYYYPEKEKRSKSWFATKDYRIVVEANNKKTISDITYSKKEVETKVYEIYCHIYDKNL